MADSMKPAYLICGTDTAKIDATRARLRARAEAEGGPSALEVLDRREGRGAPDVDALIASIGTLSLAMGRRYVLADGVERWRDKQLKEVAAAIGDLPPDLTVVLIARGKGPAPLVKAVQGAQGEVRNFDEPKAREIPRRLVEESARLGFTLEPTAARDLVERMGTSQVRLGNELERLALWAGPGGEVTSADLDEMVADSSEAAAFSLADALLDREPAQVIALSERLLAQGEGVTGLVYMLASRLRKAGEALSKLEGGMARRQVEGSLGMHPYAAKLLIDRIKDSSPEELRDATARMADLEVWCRGGAEYGDELALTLALRRAAGAAA